MPRRGSAALHARTIMSGSRLRLGWRPQCSRPPRNNEVCGRIDCTMPRGAINALTAERFADVSDMQQLRDCTCKAESVTCTRLSPCAGCAEPPYSVACAWTPGIVESLRPFEICDWFAQQRYSVSMLLLSPALVQTACHPNRTRWGQGTWLRCGRNAYRDRRSARVGVVFPTKAEAVKWVVSYEAGHSRS